MPVVGEFHTFYWENSDTTVAPVLVSKPGGYPAWQSGVVTVGMGFGGMVPYFEYAWDVCRWFWRTFGRVLRLTGESRLTLVRVLDTLDHPAYPLAQKAVRKTATTLGFNRPESWKELSRELKSDAGRAENAFRHLEACRLVRANLIDSTVSNPTQNLMVELAYHGFAGQVVGSSKA